MSEHISQTSGRSETRAPLLDLAAEGIDMFDPEPEAARQAEHSVALTPEDVPEEASESGPESGPEAGPAEAQNNETYGSFFIEDTEFALAVSVVTEVVNEPEVVSPIPLSPSYMIGLFNLRGMIVPMIDLRAIFDIPPVAEPGTRKVALIQDGDMYLGLVFDRTGEVIHAKPSERVSFQRRQDGLKDAISNGVLKLDGGKRLLQVLDPYEVLNLEYVPRMQREQAGGPGRMTKGARKQCLSFEVGHSKYAFDLEYVQEVMEVPEIKRSFLSHGYVLGSISRRGRIVPIVDFRGFVGKQTTNVEQIGKSKSNKLLIMNLLEGQIGLLVYSIDGIIRYFEQDVLPISKLAMPRDALFSGCLTIGDSDLVMLFDHDETMNQPELIAAANCCQDLYPDGPDLIEEKATAERQRRTFITFSINSQYGMDITQVCKVVDRPEALMTPPNARECVIGLFNLRDEVITLIDLRVLYGAPATGLTKQKVVIFESDDAKYGILVDKVDGIIMTTSDKVIPYKGGEGHLSDGPAALDVAEMVQVEGGKDNSNSVMVLDVEAFVKHSVGG